MMFTLSKYRVRLMICNWCCCSFCKITKCLQTFPADCIKSLKFNRWYCFSQLKNEWEYRVHCFSAIVNAMDKHGNNNAFHNTMFKGWQWTMQRFFMRFINTWWEGRPYNGCFWSLYITVMTIVTIVTIVTIMTIVMLEAVLLLLVL